jgi:hypothetical protein
MAVLPCCQKVMNFAYNSYFLCCTLGFPWNIIQAWVYVQSYLAQRWMTWDSGAASLQ